MTRLKPLRQILILCKTAQHSKCILQERVPMFNAQILSTPFCSLFFSFCSLNTQLKNKKIDNFAQGPSIYILLKQKHIAKTQTTLD